MKHRLVSALFGFSAALASFAAGAQPVYEGFFCCNLRTDASGWISDANYLEAGKKVVPFGTPAKITGYGRQRVVLDASGQKLWLGNDYSRDLDLGQFAERYIVKTDPKLRAATFPPRVVEAIRNMRVSKGMTKEQVLMSVGYPITSENSSLDAPIWRYWLDSFKPFTLMWDAQGRVRDIETDPQTRLLVVHE